MAKIRNLVLVFCSQILPIGVVLSEEAKTGVSSLYFLVGQETGSGDLVKSTSNPHYAIGFRERGDSEPGSVRYSYRLYLVTSNAVSGSDQVSFVANSRLSVFDLGFATGLCYLSRLGSICPELSLGAREIAGGRSRFAFLASGYGIVIEVAHERYQFLLSWGRSLFSQKISGILETGGGDRYSLGFGYLI